MRPAHILLTSTLILGLTATSVVASGCLRVGPPPRHGGAAVFVNPGYHRDRHHDRKPSPRPRHNRGKPERSHSRHFVLPRR